MRLPLILPAIEREDRLNAGVRERERESVRDTELGFSKMAGENKGKMVKR